MDIINTRIQIGEILAKANRESGIRKRHIYVNALTSDISMNEQMINNLEKGKTDYTINTLIKYLAASGKLDQFLEALKTIS